MGDPETEESGYDAWLCYRAVPDNLRSEYGKWSGRITADPSDQVVQSAVAELQRAIGAMIGIEPVMSDNAETPGITLRIVDGSSQTEGFYSISTDHTGIIVEAGSSSGVLYGVFALLRLMQTGDLDVLPVAESPVNRIRMVDHWDNGDGSIERGYAGRSIYYKDGSVKEDLARVADYARLLSSVGINAVSINNVNAGVREARFITPERLPDIERIAAIFRRYAIRVFVSVDYSSPMSLGGLDTADPLDKGVVKFWRDQADAIYSVIPDFGGFVVKADSENRPGPFTYDRNHAEGANVLAQALQRHNGTVIWRCFVYNCHQDWRDRSTDRARAAYDTFMELDGQFMDNVLLQVKNGPVDFQVREPVSPLIGGLEKTNVIVEFQITQEYTGQQHDLCYLIPQWKEVLDFDTHAAGDESLAWKVAAGQVFPMAISGIAAVVNVGDDQNWTGHHLAQANLYGYGRLTWNPALEADTITDEWVRLTFGSEPEVLRVVSSLLSESWSVYEQYTAPLGIGWMCNPGYHYGPSPDGYEYSMWGTYHFADHEGIGVDRTLATGSGYAGQYRAPNTALYESLDTCPDELLLFFHHVPYTHRLRSGQTVLQHIYDTHFSGVESARRMREEWQSLAGKIDGRRHKEVLQRFDEQVANAELWRDVVNTYFYRKSGVPDVENRHIYK